MNRLSVRLVLSHILVAVLGALATLIIVRQLAPALFDETPRRAQGGGPRGPGQGSGQAAGLREQFAAAVDQAVLTGAVVGACLAALFGVLAARRLVRPLGRLRAATHRIAAGDYETTVALPAETELADLATDINSLGSSIADTEQRRLVLLGEVAHEMRTPLTVIDGYVEGMIDEVLPVDPDSLGRVGEESRRLRRLADDLSALSRAEEGRLRLEPATMDLRHVVGSAAERLRPQLADAGLTMAVDCGPVELMTNVDADRISQVVTNLIGNAITATPAGGAVTVTCRPDGKWVTFAVSDTGEGLAAEDLPRVFERFYRVRNRASARTDTGSGIGLTISRDILRAHGGDLLAASGGPGRGAAFTARLPKGAPPWP